MSVDQPDVTVVLPTHNRASLLERAITSVLLQRDVGLEVVVVDDGSDDGTAEAVAGLADRRIRLLRHDRPEGVSAARNHGVAEARGRWVAFLDDDDVWAPDKLAAQLRAAGEQERDWVYVGAVNVNENLRVLGGAPPPTPEEVATGLARANLVPAGASAVLVRKSALPPEPFDASYFHCADWDLWIRLNAQVPPAWVPRPLVGYTVHADNASLDTAGMVAELDVIEERYGGPVDRAAFLRHVARVAQRASRGREAFRYYARAALHDPSYRRSGFGADVRELSRGTIRSVHRRLSTTGSTSGDGPAPPRRYQKYDEWRNEAQVWLDALRVRCS